MPRQNKSKIKSAQAKSSQTAAKAFQRSVEQRRKQAAKERKAFVRETDKNLRAIAKQIKGMGIYEPKSLEMTPYRRKRLRAVEREYRPVLKGDYFLLPIPKKDRKHVIQRAESLKLQHTKSGLIVPKEGHTKASLHRTKKGELLIERKGKTKRGINKGRNYRSITPLASLDELDKQRDRIKRMVRRLGPLDYDHGERIVFVVRENGTEGVGHLLFGNYEDLMKYLDSYNKSDAARINFYRHIHVEKITIKNFLTKYPPKDRGKPRYVKTGRHDTRGTK